MGNKTCQSNKQKLVVFLTLLKQIMKRPPNWPTFHNAYDIISVISISISKTPDTYLCMKKARLQSKIIILTIDGNDIIDLFFSCMIELKN